MSRARTCGQKSRWFTGAPLAAAAVISLLASARPLAAQALNYPALQVPSVTERSYTGAVSGSNGSIMMFQWREGISPEMHFGLDIGLYDPSYGGSNTALFFAGTLGYDLMRARSDQPLDLLLTTGAGVAISDGRKSLRLPIGVSIGHTFELDEGMAVTPFVHPRASIDICSSCSNKGNSASDVSLNFDVGASFDFSSKLSARVAVLFSGAQQYGSDEAFAVGFTWTPDGLRR